MQTKYLCVLIHIWIKGEVGVPLNRFKPSSKIFYWPFQGGTSFVDLYVFVMSCVCYVFVRVCSIVLCGQLLGKDWLLGCRLRCLTVIVSLSYLYLGSVVVLDCIDSWSLHPYLLLLPCPTRKNLPGWGFGRDMARYVYREDSRQQILWQVINKISRE